MSATICDEFSFQLFITEEMSYAEIVREFNLWMQRMNMRQLVEDNQESRHSFRMLVLEVNAFYDHRTNQIGERVEMPLTLPLSLSLVLFLFTYPYLSLSLSIDISLSISLPLFLSLSFSPYLSLSVSLYISSSLSISFEVPYSVTELNA